MSENHQIWRSHFNVSFLEFVFVYLQLLKNKNKFYYLNRHYVGKYEKDDVVFDSSRDKDKPFELQLGKHTFGKGLDVGLADMCVG